MRGVGECRDGVVLFFPLSSLRLDVVVCREKEKEKEKNKIP
jgi:hypothetical protein